MGLPQLDAAEARSAWRVRARWLSVVGGYTTAANYVVLRADAAGCTVAVAAAFALDAQLVELALTEPLVAGVVYVLGFAGDGGAPRFGLPLPIPTADDEESGDDAEAEAFGVDWDWLGDALTPDGDLPEVRGRPCLVHDLAAVAVTRPGEIFHRPDAGAALPLRVSGPNVPAELDDARAAVRRAWQADDRVRRDVLRATAGTDGTVALDGDVTPIALDDALAVAVARRR